MYIEGIDGEFAGKEQADEPRESIDLGDLGFTVQRGAGIAPEEDEEGA